eukprot:Rhum_TRINITY_DN10645_c0_g1::Rhum_TRINITY_DN10645_c0_g1_i1::g.39360::m.39360
MITSVARRARGTTAAAAAASGAPPAAAPACGGRQLRRYGGDRNKNYKDGLPGSRLQRQRKLQVKDLPRLNVGKLRSLPSFEPVVPNKENLQDRLRKKLTGYDRRRWEMSQQQGSTEAVFGEGKQARRRDDFWRWGTHHIDRISVLRAVLDRMLPRRYHKWNESTTYSHKWGRPEDSDDGETTELFILVKMRTDRVVPSVLKFRFKEVPAAARGEETKKGAGDGGWSTADESDVRIAIDYQRVQTFYQHQWAVYVARDSLTRLIVEMDDWYAAASAEEVALMGEAAFAAEQALLDAPAAAPAHGARASADLATGGRFLTRSGTRTTETTPAEEEAQQRWGAQLERAERQVPGRVMYDPRAWDLAPLKKPEWRIPRVDSQLAWHRDRESTADSHR